MVACAAVSVRLGEWEEKAENGREVEVGGDVRIGVAFYVDACVGGCDEWDEGDEGLGGLDMGLGDYS